MVRLLVHEFRRVAAQVRALPPQADPAEPALPPEDEPLPPLPALWLLDGFLVGHWAQPESRILRERPVRLWEDRDKLIAGREAMLAERARRRRRLGKREKRRERRR